MSKMSIELDPKEVLMCLNELGYYNISGKQLKEFLKDLKTLIKHDIRKLTKQNEENICPNSNRNYFYTTPSTNTQTNINNNNNINNNDVKTKTKEHMTEEEQAKLLNVAELYEHLYTTSTVSSRAKINSSKHNSVISIDIRKAKKPSEIGSSVKVSSECTKSTKSAKSTKSCSYTTIEENTENYSSTDVNSKYSKSRSDIGSRSCVSTTNKDESGQDENDNKKTARSYYCSGGSENNTKKATATSTSLKPRVSFIKPRRPVKTVKSDPVSMYQKYQNEWNKRKLPGEDRRFDLRWAIRERMLGEPEIPVHQLERATKSNRF